MKRLFLNSKINYYSMQEGLDLAEDIYVIQVEIIGNLILHEYCRDYEIADLIPFNSLTLPAAQKEEENHFDKVDEYRAVVLNNDPLFKYNDTPLGDIFDKHDADWINKALRVMKNEFIKTRIKYLKDFYIERGEKWIK